MINRERVFMLTDRERSDSFSSTNSSGTTAPSSPSSSPLIPDSEEEFNRIDKASRKVFGYANQTESKPMESNQANSQTESKPATQMLAQVLDNAIKVLKEYNNNLGVAGSFLSISFFGMFLGRFERFNQVNKIINKLSEYRGNKSKENESALAEIINTALFNPHCRHRIFGDFSQSLSFKLLKILGELSSELKEEKNVFKQMSDGVERANPALWKRYQDTLSQKAEKPPSYFF